MISSQENKKAKTTYQPIAIASSNRILSGFWYQYGQTYTHSFRLLVTVQSQMNLINPIYQNEYLPAWEMIKNHYLTKSGVLFHMNRVQFDVL
jgi:hypothetical protein